MYEDCDPSAHGEVVAIRNATKNLRTWNLQGCHLYTNFEPCAMCAAVIWLSRFCISHSSLVHVFRLINRGGFG